MERSDGRRTPFPVGLSWYGAFVSDYANDQAFAEWPQRALGWLIDGALGVVLVVVVSVLSALLHASPVLTLLVGLAWSFWLAMQLGQTGQTPGMRSIGLKAVGSTSGEPVGTGLALVRWLVHAVLGFLWIPGIIDYLFPLWDARKQTIADKAVSTVVTVVPKQPFSIVPPTAPARPM
jgi:uncharacterized RDD family membrane protein YckC